MKHYELLAPAGDFRNLMAAIDAGADAVYFGIKGFNMRAAAKNFTLEDLPKIKELCEKRKVKRYLTLNTIMYDGELKNVEDIIIKAKPFINAVICWDLSVISLCKKHDVPFHISTQASVANLEAARFYKNLGAERIVLARELSLEQIKEIAKEIEVECFCHGAMCVAISGRCFMSEHVHGLSANKGQCAQLCRRPYTITDDGGNELRLDNNRVMSAKDLCTLPFLEKLKEANVTSYKIEGRNRSPEYVKTVVSVYRKALDKKLSKEEIENGIKELEKVYNRGLSSGFYLGTPTHDDFSKTEHGEQTEKKEFIGKISKYWPKADAAALLLSHGELNSGDEVYIIGDKEAIKRVTIKSMEFQGKKVNKAIKDQEIGISFGQKVHPGDEIYLIIKVK